MSDYQIKDAYFRDKYGAYFNKALNFMKKHHGTYTDEEWNALVSDMSVKNTTDKFDIGLQVAVVNEIERVYNEGTSKTQDDFDTIYRDSFKKMFNFARLAFFYTQSPEADVWEAIVNGMGTLANATAFEREVAVTCFSIFLGVKKHEYIEDAEIMARAVSAITNAQADSIKAAA